MKIVFYNPPDFHYATSRGYVVCPSLSLPILTAVFNKAGHETQAVDLEKLKIHPDNMEIPDADVIGFTSMTVSARGLRECVKSLRKRGYKGRIVAGGNHATMFPEEVLAYGVDLVVTGECEGNVVDLFESKATGIQAGERADINDIPIPDWDKHTPKLNTYDGHFKQIRPHPAVMQWVRGCPYNCIFCGNNIFGGQATRFRSPENIEKEIKYLVERGFRNIYVYDDELVGAPLPDGWIEEVADRLEPYHLNMSTQGRCSKHFITPEIMGHVKRAGINSIFWGVESLCDEVLKAVRKHTTYADIKHTMQVSHDAGLLNAMMMQVGNYKETPHEALVTYKRLQELYRMGVVDIMRVFVTQVLPGTPLETIAKEEGWYQPHKEGWRSMNQPKYQEGTPYMDASSIKLWRARYMQACPVGDVD